MSHKIKDTKEKLAQEQPQESAAAFSNAVVNAVLCWFTTAKKMLL